MPSRAHPRLTPGPPELVTLLEGLLRRAEVGDELGIRCRNPECRSLEIKVIASTNRDEGIRRIRRCRVCGAKRRTIEMDEDAETKSTLECTYPSQRFSRRRGKRSA